MPELDYKLFLTSTTPHLDRQNSRQNHQNTAPHTLSVWNPPREKRPSWSTAVVRPFSSVFVCFRSSGFVCFTCCDFIFSFSSQVSSFCARRLVLVPSSFPAFDYCLSLPAPCSQLPTTTSMVFPPEVFLPGSSSQAFRYFSFLAFRCFSFLAFRYFSFLAFCSFSSLLQLSKFFDRIIPSFP